MDQRSRRRPPGPASRRPGEIRRRGRRSPSSDTVHPEVMTDASAFVGPNTGCDAVDAAYDDIATALEQVDVGGVVQEAGIAAFGGTRRTFLRRILAATATGLLVADPASAAVSKTKNDIAILRFDLVLEYLQAGLYTEAERLGSLTPTTLDWARVVGAHERAHALAIKNLLGRYAVKSPGFDYGSVTSNERSFIKTAVAFEDLTAALLKWQAPRLDSRQIFAAVARVVAAREAPSPAAPVVAELATQTPDNTTNIVGVVRQRTRGNLLWVEVRLPVLPNNQTGWVPRDSLGGYGFVHTHLIVDRERLTATLLDDGRRVFRAPVAVGRPGAPTPPGAFVVVDRLTRFSDPIYGPIAFGTSAKSPVFTDWPGGGVVGIHGTNEPELIPGRVSHGCIRLRNADILRLSRLMPVGTPITIR